MVVMLEPLGKPNASARARRIGGFSSQLAAGNAEKSAAN
jgi:hypothetical protein